MVDGVWTYTLDQTAVQAMSENNTTTDSVTFTATDGTEQQVRVTISGQDDAPVVSGDFVGDVTEENVGDVVTASGAVAISDVDAEIQPTFEDVADVVGDNGFGSFTLVDGVWTYTLDQAATQSLDEGDMVTDSVPFMATDGTQQEVTVTIAGADDRATVTGDSGGLVDGRTSNAPLTASGLLIIADVDADDMPEFDNVEGVQGDNGYGTFTMVDGAWTYTLTPSAVDDLADEVTDTITFTATDGTQQQVAVRIIPGFNNAPTGVVLSNSSVDENALADTLVGTLSVIDPDTGDTHILSLINDAEGRFVLNGDAVSVAEGADLEFETASSHTITIRATDEDGEFVDQDLTIDVNDLVRVVNGTDSDDPIVALSTSDIVTLGDGEDVYEGALADIIGDTLTDFSQQDALLFTGAIVDRSNLRFDTSTGGLGIDANGDGILDGEITLQGDFSGGDFMAVTQGDTTRVTFENYLPGLAKGRTVDDTMINGIINQEFLEGDGATDFQVTLRDMGFAAFNNVLGVYEVDEDGNILDTRILFENTNADKSSVAGITNVEDGHKLGFFLVQNAASWAETLEQDDVLSFISGSGAEGNVSDGGSLSLAVNGATVDAMVFHSFSADMNAGAVQQALSGVDVGGQSMTVGFEDITGGGDKDYEDVVFRVEKVDDFMFV